jgi:sugar phosphate isomerase/epimerase
MFLGYNTNGFAHHRLRDTILVLAELGYRGLGLTPDVHEFVLSELDDWWELQPQDEQAFREDRYFVTRYGLRCAIETGARFILDPRRKHQPTLLDPHPDERRKRFDFLTSAVRLASGMRADCVSFWSGAAPAGAAASELMDRLVDGCQRLADRAAEQDVRLAFELEPGMFIDTMDKFAELHARVNHPAFGLTIDVGHLVCTGEVPASKFLAQWKHVLWNVHIEDMRAGVHDHLMFGEGEVDFDDVFAGLRAAGYANGVYVELSRHSYDAVNTARAAKAFLERYFVERV